MSPEELISYCGLKHFGMMFPSELLSEESCDSVVDKHRVEKAIK